MSMKKTSDLVKLIEKRAGEANSLNEVQLLISQGADIKALTKNGSMIDSVISEANRHQQTSPWKAQNCQKLIQVLQSHASYLLANSVLSSDGGNLTELISLFRIRASCYQSDKYGPLGLLGELLKQEKTPIRLDIIKFLVENDSTAKFGLTQINDQRQTCISLSRNNPKCSQDVRKFLQDTFDIILNQIPNTHPQIDVNEVAEWIYRGANPEAVDKHGNTVLLNAALANNHELVDTLVSVGCNTAHTNNNNLTALQIVQNATPRNAQLETILKAQMINAELKRLIETKKSLLTFDEVSSLLKKGAKINTPIANKSTFLHLLIANEGTPEMVTTFINDFNADISAMDIHGYRSIESCILFDKTPFSVLQTYFNLSKIPITTFFNTKLNKSILQFAQEQNRPEAAKIIQDALNLRLWNTITHLNTNDEPNRSVIPELNHLIKYGAQVDHKHSDKEYENWTILHLACKIATKSVVQFLIEQLKVNYTLSNGQGDYPLSIAAQYGHLFILQYLHGLRNVQLNISNKDKKTPLHLATKNHHLLVVRYLILWGADHLAEDIDKQTPLDIARSNTSKNKKDEIVDKTLIHFLEQLICPAQDQRDSQLDRPTKPPVDLDICELVKPIIVDRIQMTTVGDEERLGQQSKGFFSGNANDNLLNAAREGFLNAARAAIGEGANICYKKNNTNAHDTATQSITEYHKQMIVHQTRLIEWQHYKDKAMACQQIAEDIRQIAYKRLVQSIEESIPYRVMAYHQAGAPLTGELLYYSCNISDNVQIVDYLINQSSDIYQTMFNYSKPESPYHTAKKNKFNNVAAYLKYRLSVECTKAIQANDIEYTKKLIHAGASVDMQDTNNLSVAINHRNVELIQILCDNGAKMPIEWLESQTITLPENIAQTMDPNIVVQLNRSLINRRLRLAAASGDLHILIHCQHLAADINSLNCHGSTALLCSIQYGNYFPIVHALVSRGATILHANENECMSLIALAKKHNYIQITNYLSQELNTQFLNTILNNDLKSAEKFEALGADFNYRDEQKRTALHYAVQYHGIDLVSWLCIRGSAPTFADIDGNYPIIEATEKGDYAVVELFATKYPATKQQKNKSGLTALQIAEKLGFKRIAYVLETGESAPDSIGDNGSKSNEPKHTKDVLIHAAKNGHIKIIREFIEDRYESRDDKRKLCFQLINVAKKATQREIIGILQLYYDKQLKAELPSDINTDSGLRLNEHYKKILLGFLTSLSRIIAESPVVLDPSDPNTYQNLFENLTVNQKKRSEEIYKVNSERDVLKLSDQDMLNINEKLTNIDHELTKLNEEKEILEKNMQETSEKLKLQEKITAIQRQDLFKQQEEHKKQLAVYECSIFLYELQQEATINRQNTVNYIYKNANMYLFFRTVENMLQALFHGALAARSGIFTMEKNTKVGTASKVVDFVPVSIIPVVGGVLEKVTKGVSTVLSKLDERQQKKEYYNISTFGNIEELGRIASDTASLVTLYYKEQIQLIDTSRKISGSNIFNEKCHWIKDIFIDFRPEEKEEMAVVLVAEYITAWIIGTLKGGEKNFVLTDPLPQQLWFCVAKQNCIEQGKMTAFTDVIGATAGRQKIPLKIPKDNGETILTEVQLRYLIGCVSVVTEDNEIYQYDVSKESSNEELTDLKLFGYVYVTPFLNSNQSAESIVTGRNLLLAARDSNNDILTKLKDIEQYVQNFQDQGDRDRESAVTKETARQVAQVLREEKTFVDPQDVKNMFDQSRQDIEISIDVLREDIQEKTIYYQTSIDATSEKLQNAVAEGQELLKKDNEKHYNNVLKRINDQLTQVEKNLEDQIKERMNTIEKQLKVECNEMRTIVDAAKVDSERALIQANEAVQISKQSAQYSEQAREDVKKLIASTEQRRQEFQIVMDRCETNVKQTINEQKRNCEQTITAIRTKVHQDFERTKTLAEQAVTNAKESAQAAKDSAKSAQETQKDSRKQLDLQKEETQKIISETKEITKQNQRSADEAKEASKQAKQAVDASTTALKKLDEMYKKMESALERLEKLSKKLETK